MKLGPVLIGIEGTVLDSKARTQLSHPAVGGVVLFSRNCENRSQVTDLCAAIGEIRSPRLLICVDQEGGRIQRLREGFTPLPPLGLLGQMYHNEPQRAVDMAYRHARVMAGEVLTCGIDLSFAPVLDLDRGSTVIGDRSLSASPEIVLSLGRHYLAGMHDAGMKSTGKHFPGHGSVSADSHTHDVADFRPLAELEAADLVPFIRLAADLDSLMVAHVLYPAMDDTPAGYSRKWLLDYLRGSCGYAGVILSDDLGMHAAHVAGDLHARTRCCLQAGCDLVLVCQPEDVEELLRHEECDWPDTSQAIASLYGNPPFSYEELRIAKSQGVGEWNHWQQSLSRLSKTLAACGEGGDSKNALE